MEHSADDLAWSDVVRLYGRVEHELAAVLQRRHGLGLSEYRALCHLADATESGLRMQELADLLGLNQSSVTRLVGRLEGAGLSRRDLCEQDRRGVYTVITEEGRERHLGAIGTYEATLTAALDQAATEPALTAVVSGLRAGA